MVWPLMTRSPSNPGHRARSAKPGSTAVRGTARPRKSTAARTEGSRGAGATKHPPPTVKAWAPARPLDRPTLPTFPTECLPDWLRAWVEAQAEALQVPKDLPALLALAVVATGVARRMTFNLRPGWTEPLNLYTLVALPSGARKSVVFEAATRPLTDHERELARPRLDAVEVLDASGEDLRDLAEFVLGQPQLRLVVDGREVAPPGARGGAADDYAEFGGLAGAARIAGLGEAARGGARPETGKSPSRRRRGSAQAAPPLRLFVGDVTPERVGSLLVENGGRMAVLSDEGEVCEVLGGRHGSAAIEVFLKGYSGTPVSIERVTRERVYVDRPALTLGLAVQPDVLNTLAAKRVLRERGLLARFLVAVPKSNLGYRKVDAPPVSPEVRAAYEARVHALLGLPELFDEEGEPAAQELRPTPGARRVLVDFEHEVEEMLRPDGMLAPIASWGSKLVGMVGRLAGLLHAAAHVGGAEGLVPDEVDERTANRAIELGRYAIAHALAAFGPAAGANPNLEGAKQILTWIRRNRLRKVGRRDIHQGLRTHFEQAVDLDSPLGLLVQKGWLRPIPPPQRRTRGRPPSPRFEVHPDALV